VNLDGRIATRHTKCMTTPQIFDRRALQAHRQRAARTTPQDDFVTRTMMEMAAEQLGFIARRFNSALVVSSLQPAPFAVSQVHKSDLGFGEQVTNRLDLESPSLRENTYDMTAIIGGLNWVNDLPGCLIQLRRALKPDGFFLGIFVGGDSLQELRSCLMQAESDVVGGAAARVNPMIEVRDAGALLQRAGFAMPVADVDRLTVRYANPLKLLSEIRMLGETAAFIDKAPMLRRDVLARMCELYIAKYAGADGKISATLDIISISGWAPGDNQPLPKARGSGAVSLAQVLGKN
jgi:NADH dehydrogenase [ubiquinone] 1 alpha subcomplex assembly factor 5